MSTDLGTTSRTPQSPSRPSADHAAHGADAPSPPWLEAAVATCACPECGAPMTVRRWLMTADCWRCDVSISLTYLWDTSTPAERVRALPAGAPTDPRPTRDTSDLPTRVREPAQPAESSPRPSAVLPPRFRPKKQRNWRSLLEEMAACLLSMAAHLLLLILLALLTFGRREELPQIKLSLNVDPMRIEGELKTSDDAVERVGFKLPVPEPTPQEDPRELEARLWDDEIVAPTDPTPNLPAYSELKESVRSEDQYERMLSSRDPRIRREVIAQEGGTTRTEAAVARALRWIALHQAADGSWSLDGFHRADSCSGRCRGRGSIRSNPGGTALALQAFLGAGQTHRVGVYREQVAAGLDYLLTIQQPDGDLRGDSLANAGMYVQALAAIALCDALALTGDDRLRLPAQRAIDFIVHAQHGSGGWRYVPGEEGDTSVVGWQLMAIHSARAARLQVSDSALVGAHTYLNAAQTDRWGGFYAYRPGGRATPAMTAEGLLSRMYLGWQKKDRGLRLGVLTLAEEFPPDEHDPDIYYWYYATQVMHHWGGRPWYQWNRQMSDLLVRLQIDRGHEAGSWDPKSPHGHQGGRLYMTTLACCTLEVYYRHAPLFRKIELD